MIQILYACSPCNSRFSQLCFDTELKASDDHCETLHSVVSLAHLFYCTHCDRLACRDCSLHEPASYYCPVCLFEVPSATVQSEHGRYVLQERYSHRQILIGSLDVLGIVSIVPYAAKCCLSCLTWTKSHLRQWSDILYPVPIVGGMPISPWVGCLINQWAYPVIPPETIWNLLNSWFMIINYKSPAGQVQKLENEMQRMGSYRQELMNTRLAYENYVSVNHGSIGKKNIISSKGPSTPTGISRPTSSSSTTSSSGQKHAVAEISCIGAQLEKMSANEWISWVEGSNSVDLNQDIGRFEQ